MTSLRKVSQLAHRLVAQGLLDADVVRRLILVAALEPTLVETGCAVPMAALVDAVGSATIVAEELERLRALGFAVEQVATSGVRLARPFDDLLVPEAVVWHLADTTGVTLPLSIGLPYRYQQRCESTNLELKNNARVLPSGALVVTDEQTQGRGRLGRSWVSGPGQDLTFSLLIRPTVSPETASVLSLAAAVATAETLDGLPGLQGRVMVKWPNDVLVDGKKVCGILLESSVDGDTLEWVIIGVGLNVNSDPSTHFAALGPAATGEWRGRPRPTSLSVEVDREVARGRLLADLLSRMGELMPDVDAPELLDRMRSRDALLGRRLKVFSGPPDGVLVVAGEGAGLGSRGELLVRGSDGRILPVMAGEVTLSVDS